jgi:hypothetical protein
MYGKLKETGQEVTPKSACIYLFDRVCIYLPIWSEINESRYFANPDVEKLLLKLETRGRQLEYESVSLVTLKSAGDGNPKGSISDSKSKGAESRRFKNDQNSGPPQGQGQRQRQQSPGRYYQDNNRNNKKEDTSHRENRYCEPCDRKHPGDC